MRRWADQRLWLRGAGGDDDGFTAAGWAFNGTVRKSAACAYGERPSLWSVVRAYLETGRGSGIAGRGFAVIGTFIHFILSAMAGPLAGFTLTAFGGAFVLMRILFGWMPDRFGGVKTPPLSHCWCRRDCCSLVAGADGTDSAGRRGARAGCSLIFRRWAVEVIERTCTGTRYGARAATPRSGYLLRRYRRWRAC